MDSISLLIPTHNRVEQLEVTLASIAAQQVADAGLIEVVVVANGCTDNTIEFIESRIAAFPFELKIFDETQLGLPYARNRSIKEANKEVLAFIDDDVVLSPGYLQGMLDIYASHGADLVGGRTELFWDAIEKPDWFPDGLLHLLSCKDHGNEIKELFVRTDAIGCNFSFRRSVVEAIGDFKLGLGRTGKLLIGGEESEFIDRALSSGLRLFYAPKCHLKHWVAPNRASMKYLTGVAQGNAVGAIFARARFSWPWVLKATLFHTWCYLKHLFLAFQHQLLGDKSKQVFHTVKRSSQFGFLKGVWLRATGQSTLSAEPRIEKV